jgi:hypothetical protein
MHNGSNTCPSCCDGVLEANLNSNVIDVAHIGWLSRDPGTNSKGRNNEWGRSVEDLTGLFTIEKFIIQFWHTDIRKNYMPIPTSLQY